MAWFGSNWFRSFWFASNWFAGTSGGTTPPATGSGGGLHRPARRDEWAAILRQRPRRRHRGTGHGTAPPASGVGTGTHHRRHTAAGQSFTAPTVARATGRRIIRGSGTASAAGVHAAGQAQHHDDAADLLLLAEIAVENW